MRRPIVNANFATLIRRIAMSQRSWNMPGRWPWKLSSRPKRPNSNAPRVGHRLQRPSHPPCKPPSVPLGTSCLNSGRPTSYRRRSAKPYSAVSLTRWYSSGPGAIRFTPVLSGAAAKPPPWRSRWRSALSPISPRRPPWRNRFGCSLPRAKAMMKWPAS